MANGDHAYQAPTMINGSKIYIPVAVLISVVVLVAGAILWITGMFDSQRQEREANFIRKTEFNAVIEPVQRDVSETREDVKDIQKDVKKILESQNLQK